MIDKVMELYKKRTEKECYKIDIVDGVPDILDNKIGGTPYIPVGEEYPMDKNNNPMILLVQINLENIELDGFPKEGILEVFVDRELSYPCDYKVKYYKSNLEYRTDIPSMSENYIIETPLKINLIKDVERMPLNDYRFYDTMSSVIKDVTGVELKNYMDIEKYFKENGCDMYDELYKVNIFEGNLGGYADFTQTDPRPLGDKNECLLKLDSNLGHGIMFGDSGILFVFISKSDLANSNFKESIVDWDCC